MVGADGAAMLHTVRVRCLVLSITIANLLTDYHVDAALQVQRSTSVCVFVLTSNQHVALSAL